PPTREQPARIDTFLAYSADELLRTRDFDQMSADELARARAVVRRFELDVRPLVTRRTRPAPRGEIDRARTIRAALRGGGELVMLRHRDRIERPPAIVALCDISARWAATPRCCCGSSTRCSSSATAATCSCSRPGSAT
ncbi:MAG TPA: VWA domain-containing protein, partial [Kofleriaceae bacterium]|nr:VWA domain-containing protein [Kofleriaceae bacterium]